MAFIDRSTRVGRSQGASIFWGLVSVCFAAAACFYYLKNHDNERIANQMRDQAMQLREENESLVSQKDHLQAAQDEAASELKTREDLVAQKETELAQEEQHLDELSQQSEIQSQGNLAQVAIVKKFNDVIRRLGKDQPDVVERGGRPVLRVPNAQLFALGDATLTPDGKAMLGKIATALNEQLDHFELRVVAYTDTDAESDAAGGAKKDATQSPAPPAEAKPHVANSWELTAARAAALARYFRDQTQLPFLSVLVIARGDSEPISSNTGDNHARNRRVEITITPMPISFHAPEADATTPGTAPPTKPAPTPAPTPPPAPVKKDKPKKAEKDQVKTPDKDPVKTPVKGTGR